MFESVFLRLADCRPDSAIRNLCISWTLFLFQWPVNATCTCTVSGQRPPPPQTPCCYREYRSVLKVDKCGDRERQTNRQRKTEIQRDADNKDRQRDRDRQTRRQTQTQTDTDR